MDRMKSDIQIAQEAEMMHIKDVAATIGIPEEDWSSTESTKQNSLMNSGKRSRTERTGSSSL